MRGLSSSLTNSIDLCSTLALGFSCNSLWLLREALYTCTASLFSVPVPQVCQASLYFAGIATPLTRQYFLQMATCPYLLGTSGCPCVLVFKVIPFFSLAHILPSFSLFQLTFSLGGLLIVLSTLDSGCGLLLLYPQAENSACIQQEACLLKEGLGEI